MNGVSVNLAGDDLPLAVCHKPYSHTNLAIGMDYRIRPSVAGLPCPVNDIIIVKDNVVMGVGEVGEIWMSVVILILASLKTLAKALHH